MDLWVSLNGIIVGQLHKDKNGGLHFTYQDEWLTQKGARPISLSLPLTSIKYSGDKVYNFFDNLLPDNLKIRDKIQSRFKVSSSHAFDLLSAVGNDCVGAIQLSIERPKKIQKIEYKELSSEDVASLLANYQDAPLGMFNENDDFRISLAGAQEKTALLQINGKWTKPVGTTPTSHILKLPIGVLPHVNIDLTDSCENEFICLELARAFGFNVANSEVLTFDKQKVLSVERFDRRYSSDKTWIMRLPQEDFCQAMGFSSGQKYQADGGPNILQCMNLLTASSNASDRAMFFKSQILFWLLAAIDGHGKNFSIFLEAGNRYKMTPLYDILSAYPLIKKGELQKQKIKMAMSLKSKNNHWKWDRIQSRHFISTAVHVGYDPKEAQENVEFMMDNIEHVIATVEQLIPSGFPEYIAESIFSGVRSRAHSAKAVTSVDKGS